MNVFEAALRGKQATIARLVRKGESLDGVDADGFTALGRVAIDALGKRVARWQSEGDIEGVPVSYTVTDGVMVFRKRGKPTPMSFDQQLAFSKRWCKELRSYLDAISMCCRLIEGGASLAHEDGEGETTLERLQALGHPSIAQAIADQPAGLERKARRARGDARRAARYAASARRLTKAIAAAKAKAKAKAKPKAKATAKTGTKGRPTATRTRAKPRRAKERRS